MKSNIQRHIMSIPETRLCWDCLSFAPGDQTMSILVVPAIISLLALAVGIQR